MDRVCGRLEAALRGFGRALTILVVLLLTLGLALIGTPERPGPAAAVSTSRPSGPEWASRPSGPEWASRPSGPEWASHPSGPEWASRPSGPEWPSGPECVSHPAQVDSAAHPDPSPALAEQRDEEQRTGAEDDDLAHGLRPGFALPPARAGDVRRIRGPPPALRHATWRPRSSRGPPELVLAVPSRLS